MSRGHLRLFVAITLPDPVRDALGPVLPRVAAIAPGARVVPPANLHVTLRFLGATPEEDLPRLDEALAAAAAESGAFELELAGAGSFGSRARPRVLYAAVAEGAPQIASLAARVSAALGLAPETRYTPHVTLARARGQRGDRDLAGAQADLVELAAPRFWVASMALLESRLSPQGARYQILQEAPFPA